MRTAYPITTKLGRHIPFIMLSTWLNFEEILLLFFSQFFRKILNPFLQLKCLPYLRNGWSNWCEAKRSQLDAMLTSVNLTLTFDLDLWPWIFKVKLYLWNGRPDCHGTKGTGVDRMPWCETLREWVNWTLHWLGYLWPWPLTLNFQGQIVSREWEAWFSWNKRDGSQ